MPTVLTVTQPTAAPTASHPTIAQPNPKGTVMYTLTEGLRPLLVQSVRDLITQARFGTTPDGRSCTYLDHAGGSCVAGLFFRRLGVDPHDLPRHGSVTTVATAHLDGYRTSPAIAAWGRQLGVVTDFDIRVVQYMQAIHDRAATESAYGKPMLHAILWQLANPTDVEIGESHVLEGSSIYSEALMLPLTEHLADAATKVYKQGWFGTRDDNSCAYLDIHTNRQCIAGYLFTDKLGVSRSDDLLGSSKSATGMLGLNPKNIPVIGIPARPITCEPESTLAKGWQAAYGHLPTAEEGYLVQACQRVHDDAASQIPVRDTLSTDPDDRAALKAQMIDRLDTACRPDSELTLGNIRPDSEEEQAYYLSLAKLIWKTAKYRSELQ